MKKIIITNDNNKDNDNDNNNNNITTTKNNSNSNSHSNNDNDNDDDNDNDNDKNNNNNNNINNNNNNNNILYAQHGPLILWGDNLAAILQATFLNVFPSMKMFESWSNFQWSLFLTVHLTTVRHWFK